MKEFDLTLKEFNEFAKGEMKKYILGYMFNTRDSGDTIITCKSKFISKKEIEEILSILHPDYKDLGATINIHGNRFHTFMRLLNPLYIGICYATFKGAYKGIYAGNHNQGNIDLFSYNHVANQRWNKEIPIKLHIIYDILHEIRHAYQLKHKERKYMKCSRNYVNAGSIGYSEQWIERDANAFATRVMNKHHNKINEILNIGTECKWETVWGYFRKSP